MDKPGAFRADDVDDVDERVSDGDALNRMGVSSEPRLQHESDRAGSPATAIGNGAAFQHEPLSKFDDNYRHARQTSAGAQTSDASEEVSVSSAYGDLPPVIVPPYWHGGVGTQEESRTTDHSYGRTFANGNGHWNDHRRSSKLLPITLEDNTLAVDASGVLSPLWARAVTIQSYTIVSGNVKGVGDYVVWTCCVETHDGGSLTIHKRYSEFETLRQRLAMTFPRSHSSLPSLPPKSVLYKFRPSFLEKRRAGLEYFLNCAILNPEFASAPVLKDFIFN